MQGQSQQEALLPGREGQALRASQQPSGLASPTGIQVSDCSPEQGMGCWRKWGDQDTVRRERLITCSGPSGVRDRGCRAPGPSLGPGASGKGWCGFPLTARASTHDFEAAKPWGATGSMKHLDKSPAAGSASPGVVSSDAPSLPPRFLSPPV